MAVTSEASRIAFIVVIDFALTETKSPFCSIEHIVGVLDDDYHVNTILVGTHHNLVIYETTLRCSLSRWTNSPVEPSGAMF
jgi:hypothetical protein